MGFHLPGELFGLDGLETDIHTCSAIALETTSLCELPLNQLDNLCSSIPGLSHQMHRLIGKEVTTEHEMLFLLGKKDAEERLSSFLISISNRLSQRGFSATEFNLSMSRQDIGNYLGLALETVSRQFTHFQEQGIIDVERRHITINDMVRLKEVAVKPSQSVSDKTSIN
jgi:CRP/FNR family transcriptional regulator